MLAQASGEPRTGRLPGAQTVCDGIAVVLCLAALGFGPPATGDAALSKAGTNCDHIKCYDYASQMSADTATAVRLVSATDAEGFPADAAWETAPPIRFSADWQGRNTDAQRQTEVRLLWTPETLYLRFDAAYRAITVFADADSNGRRDQLWDRDVCEVFIQPDPSELHRYKEIEVAPNGFWIDLDIAPGEKHDLRSGLRRRVDVDEKLRRWRAVVALPVKSLAQGFDSSAVWRVNFYRVEGSAEPRFYSAWRPTHTPQPNFHVPEAFGRLVFAEGIASR
jgi:alpha-galactosidase